MKIWLDDIRPAPGGWEWAKNSDDFWDLIEQVHEKQIDIEAISFDNDLGPGEMEGWEIAKRFAVCLGCYGNPPTLLQLPIDLECHSANIVAKARIKLIFADINHHLDSPDMLRDWFAERTTPIRLVRAIAKFRNKKKRG